MNTLSVALVWLATIATVVRAAPLAHIVTGGDASKVNYRNVAKPAELLVKKSVVGHGTGEFLVESRNFTVSITMYNVGESPAENIVLVDTWDEDLFEIVEGSARYVGVIGGTRAPSVPILLDARYPSFLISSCLLLLPTSLAPALALQRENRNGQGPGEERSQHDIARPRAERGILVPRLCIAPTTGGVYCESG